MRALLVFALCLPAASLAQVRTSDAPYAIAVGAGLGYIADVGRTGPAVGAEVAMGAVSASASLTFPGDETGRAFSLAALVYPAGRTSAVAVAVGAEYDIVGGGGRSSAFVGPVASVSYRLVHGAGGSVIPEVLGGMLIPIGNSSGGNAGLQIGATARVTVAAPFGGARVYLTPAVSRSVDVSSFDGPTYAASVEAGITADL